MKNTKTVMEWNSYITITQKKLNKALLDFNRKMFVISTKGEYSLDVNKAKIDKEVAEIQSLYTKIGKLNKNIEIVKEARQQFNFNTIITVNGKKMNIVTALNRFQNRENELYEINNFLTGYNKLNEKLELLTQTYDSNKDRLNKEVSGNNRQATKSELDLVANRIEDFEPLVFDPLSLKEIYTTKKEDLDNFLLEVNAKINIANATNNLELDLEQE